MGLKFEITTSFGILKSVFLNELTPNVLKKVKGVFKKDKSESADDFSEITQDDIDG